MKLLQKIKKALSWAGRKISNLWLAFKCWYWLSWAKRACYHDQTVYYILLNPRTREVWCVNSNEYAVLNRQLKRQKDKLKAYVYAKVSPFG